MLTQERLKELLHYHPETGVFTRLVRTSNNTKVGDIVGTVGSGGYLACSIDWSFHQMHRLAFLYMTGSFPTYDVDHLNGKPTDNRWCNLRDEPTKINMQNERRARKNSTTGIMGVTFRRGKWIACLKSGKKQVYRGAFDDPELAGLVYLEAERLHHPGFLL